MSLFTVKQALYRHTSSTGFPPALLSTLVPNNALISDHDLMQYITKLLDNNIQILFNTNRLIIKQFGHSDCWVIADYLIQSQANDIRLHYVHIQKNLPGRLRKSYHGLVKLGNGHHTLYIDACGSFGSLKPIMERYHLSESEVTVLEYSEHDLFKGNKIKTVQRLSALTITHQTCVLAAEQLNTFHINTLLYCVIGNIMKRILSKP